ncbi:MAG: NnrS family protein [Gammaproteobacteria bacterium]|nr:NnrS family protein [Gammaproteobacteria bacterium]
MPKPYRLAFPVAAIFAATYVPLWMIWPKMFTAAASSALWHGHEMLFGYGLLVVAGFLTTRPGAHGLNTWLLVMAWLLARATAFFQNDPLVAVVGLLFPIVVLVSAATPLLRGAKRPENLIAPCVLALFVITDAVWWAGVLSLNPALQHRALLSTVDGFALLLLVIAGRALPAAVGGYLERRGIPRRDRIRHGYELPVAAFMGGAFFSDLFGYPSAAGTFSVGAAFVALWRTRAWQLHHSLARPDLWALALGYLWLVPGLLLKGSAQLVGSVPVALALHGITVGSLATLTLVMMARTTAARAHQRIAGFRDIGVAACLLTIATLCRLLANEWPLLLWGATATWSLAFLLLLKKLLRTNRSLARPRRKDA